MAFVHRPQHTLDTGFNVSTFVHRMSVAPPYDRNMYVKQLLELATSQDTKSLKLYVLSKTSEIPRCTCVFTICWGCPRAHESPKVSMSLLVALTCTIPPRKSCERNSAAPVFTALGTLKRIALKSKCASVTQIENTLNTLENQRDTFVENRSVTRQTLENLVDMESSSVFQPFLKVACMCTS